MFSLSRLQSRTSADGGRAEGVAVELGSDEAVEDIVGAVAGEVEEDTLVLERIG